MHGNRYIQSIQLVTSSKDVVSNGDQKIQSMWLLISYMPVVIILKSNLNKQISRIIIHIQCVCYYGPRSDQ